MPDIVETAENVVTKPISWAKNNPLAFILLMLVALLVILHFSVRMQSYLATKAAGGGVWHTVAKWTGAVAAVAIFALFASHAQAAIAQAAGFADFGTWLLMAGAVAFPLSDFCALKDETGNYTSVLNGPFTAPIERQFIFRAEREKFAGFPLRVTDLQFGLTLNILQGGTSGGNLPVAWDELFRVCDGLEISSPRFGTICSKDEITGPVLKHMVEYIGSGYSYSGDEAFGVITPQGGTYLLNLFFGYPIMQRYLAKPDESAMFAGWLQQTQLKFRLAASASLAPLGAVAYEGSPITLRCGFRYFVGAVAGDIRRAYPVPPLACSRVIKTSANGQYDILFPGIGATGPQNTDVSGGERLVAAMLLTNQVGLPGPGTFENVTEMGCEQFGQLPTESPDMWVLAKLAPQRQRNQIIDGIFSLSYKGWPYSLLQTGIVPDQGRILTPQMYGLPYALPSLGEKISKMPRIKGDITIHARQGTPPAGSGLQYALYLHTLRDIDGTYAAKMLADAGISGTVTRAVNHNADAAVQSGARSRRGYVGMPQVAK